MQDRPSRQELLEGIVHFLEKELVPVLQDPLRFHTRVAANLLRIIDRETALEKEDLNREVQGLRRLLALMPAAGEDSPDRLPDEVIRLNQELCRRIREGQADAGPRHREVMQHLRDTLIRKLEIANPDFISKALTKN
jgi:hypothetical protein